MEMSPEEHVDPCEVSFHDYRQADGRRVPGRMEVRPGDERYATFPIERFESEAKPGS